MQDALNYMNSLMLVGWDELAAATRAAERFNVRRIELRRDYHGQFACSFNYAYN